MPRSPFNVSVVKIDGSIRRTFRIEDQEWLDDEAGLVLAVPQRGFLISIKEGDTELAFRFFSEDVGDMIKYLTEAT